MLTRYLCGVLVVLAACPALAQDWATVGYVGHSAYQAVNADGSSAYGGAFPVRMVGVVLNDSQDWLNPAPGYTATYQPFVMGGEAEFYFQALWKSTVPELGVEYYDGADFGGTACWIGQNYGNLPFKADPYYSYTDVEWVAQLARLGLYGGGVSDPIRAGDLVEVRARAGLHYKGKMNVNEQHDKSAAKDFEVVRLVAGYGLPEPAAIALSDLKNSDNTFIFDPTRQSGGERRQSTLVELGEVWVTAAAGWTRNSDITVTDGTRTLVVHLGLNDSFDGAELFGVGERFKAVGILDQSSTNGTYGTDGYRLLVMNAGDLSAVPEPATALLAGAGALLALRRRRRAG